MIRAFPAPLSFGLIVALASPAAALQSTQFGTQQLITSAATGVADVFPADLDGDGDIDMVAALTGADRVAWYRNNGNGSFTQRVLANGMENTTCVTAADLDGDGDLDVVAGAPGLIFPPGSNNSLRVFRNNGNGSFTSLTIPQAVPGIWDVTTSDMDGDGDLDIVISLGAIFDQIGWFRNNGNLNFGGVQAISTSSSTSSEPRDVHTADVDGDGDMDVLAANYNGNDVSWYRNNGSSWTRQVISGAQGARNVRTGDMDGDGVLDVVSTSVLDRRVAWYRGLGGGNFSSQRIISTANNEYRGLHLVDADLDGDLDVFTTSETNNRVDWYENLGGNNFSSSHVITNGMAGANCVASADMDGDGVPDIVAGAPGNNRITWYENLLDPNALGTNYCTGVPNSSGAAGSVTATGSNTASDNDLTIIAESLPNNSFGFFLVSQTQFFIPNPGGSQGNLCIAGDIGRYVGPGQIQNSGTGGTFSLLLDLTQVPQPTGFVSVQAGETWNFTTWFRDAIFGLPVSNFTDGFSITFQ
ncbi:MAG: VCBS repeat-containing protein [Planctomycetota bacterium]|nr:VCBS repeat-containing protein [Planctomycetota bacterium]